MIDRAAYLADPCGTLSIPYFKAVRMETPAHLRIVHARDFDGMRPGERDARYFRLAHSLAWVDAAVWPDGYTPRVLTEADAAQLADLLASCYAGTWNQGTAARLMRESFAYAPGQCGVWTPKGALVGCCLSAMDCECREGTIEWLAVHPAHRRKGIACALVNTCLAALRSEVDFATVSGQMDNPTNPLGVYRRCGFEGNDVWHIIQNDR